MLYGLYTTKRERELAEARATLAHLRERVEDAERASAAYQHAWEIELANRQDAEAALDREVRNAERLSDLCVRYEETLITFERIWEEREHPIKDPSAVILLDPIGVPKGTRPKGQVISLRKERSRAIRRADQDSVRRNAVLAPPKALPPSQVRPDERAAVRDVMTVETEE